MTKQKKPKTETETEKKEEDDNDPYKSLLKSKDQNKLQEHTKESTKRKKLDILKSKSAELWAKFQMGFTMGAMVGCSFGVFIGGVTAYQTRRYLAIPMSIVVSGIGFGFVLGCGSMVRNQEQGEDNYHEAFYSQDVMHLDQFWKTKYAMYQKGIRF